MKLVDATYDANKWMPIETAPKDGSAILLFEVISFDYSDKTENYVFSGCYNERRNPKFYGTEWECLEYSAFNRYPTHWMPLPLPPKDKP